MNDLLALPERLGTQTLGRSLEILEEVASTMDSVRDALAAGCPDGHLVVADHQSAGRGSHGRPWLSPPGSDLYFSFAWRLPVGPALPVLTLAVGLGVADAVDALLGEGCTGLKWPNDVYLGDKKLSGILVETRLRPRNAEAVIGIGLNVRRQAFPEGLPATSLALHKDIPWDRSEVLAAMLKHIELRLRQFQRDGADPIAEAVDERLLWRGQEVRLDERRGVLRGVNPDGSLAIEGPEGMIRGIAGRLQKG